MTVPFEEGSFLSLLTTDEVDELRRKATRRRYRRDSTLILQGDRSDTVQFVLTGRVKASHLTPDGKDVVLAVRGPGTIVGEQSAFDAGPRSATVTALDPVETLVTAGEAFRDFVARHPGVALVLLATMSRRLRQADGKRVEYSAYDIPGRVARLLLELSREYGEAFDGAIKIGLPLSQEELAGWVGASRVAVSKALRLLRVRGAIETRYRAILVLDTDALEQLAT